MQQQARSAGSSRSEAGSRSLWSRVPVLPIALFAGVLAIFVDLVTGGFLLQLDKSMANVWPYDGPYSYPTADIFDKIGQRSVCVPVLLAVAYVLSRRLGSIRPLVIALGGTLALNFVVGVIKLVTMRESPRTGGPEFFVGSNLFPSGHTANVVFMFGLAVALILRYGNVTTRQQLLLIGAVVGIFLFMTLIAIYRHTHWFTDLVAGGMVGAAVLDVCMRADAFWPEFRGWLRGIAGPTWAGVEWAVRRLRPIVVREGAEPGRVSTTSAAGDAPRPPVPSTQPATTSGQQPTVVLREEHVCTVCGERTYDDYAVAEASELAGQEPEPWPSISGRR